MLDVIQISYHEPSADENFEILRMFAPLAKRVQGVRGIFNAHKAAAEIAETTNFYVVDADAIIDEKFDFSFRPRNTVKEYGIYPQTDCVHVWRSINPINDLIYGYGGVKLFPRRLLRQAESWNVDMTTSLNAPFVPQAQISNITAFNTDPFATWRSAFRECVKLASASITNSDNRINLDRLETWCTVGADRPYGEYAILGAKQGKDFGEYYSKYPKKLKKINDYEWLKEAFDEAIR